MSTVYSYLQTLTRTLNSYLLLLPTSSSSDFTSNNNTYSEEDREEDMVRRVKEELTVCVEEMKDFGDIVREEEVRTTFRAIGTEVGERRRRRRRIIIMSYQSLYQLTSPSHTHTPHSPPPPPPPLPPIVNAPSPIVIFIEIPFSPNITNASMRVVNKVAVRLGGWK